MYSKKEQKMVLKTNYRLMQVKSIAECSKRINNATREHSAILSTFIKLPFVFKTFVLSIFEWRLQSGFTVDVSELCPDNQSPDTCSV